MPCLLRMLLGLPAQPAGGRQLQQGAALLASMDLSTPAAATAYLSIISSVQVDDQLGLASCGGGVFAADCSAVLCCTSVLT